MSNDVANHSGPRFFRARPDLSLQLQPARVRFWREAYDPVDHNPITPWLIKPYRASGSYKDKSFYLSGKAPAPAGDINFGYQPTFAVNGRAYPVGDIDLTIHHQMELDGSAPAPYGVIDFEFALPPVLFLLDASSPNPLGDIEFEYEEGGWHGVASSASSGWRLGARHRARLQAAHQSPIHDRAIRAQRWSVGDLRENSICAGHQESDPLRGVTRHAWDAGAGVSARTRAAHQSGVRREAERRARWMLGSPINSRSADRWIVLYRDARPARRNPWQIARTLPPLSWCSDWQPGRWTLKPYCWDWQEGRDVYGWGRDPYYWTPPTVPDPLEGCYTPPPGGAVPLNLWQSLATIDPLNVRLNFVCESSWGGRSKVIVPILKVYLTMDSASLCLLPECTEIHCLQMSIATDADSWCWSLTATLPASELAKVSPVGGSPAEVRATINGVQWHFLVEHISRSREFGRASLQIRGRSLTAYLDEPYALIADQVIPGGSTAAVQLAQNALPYGYGLTWALTMDPFNEWVVPEGAWTHRGTGLKAVLDLAGAVEAVVQSHRTAESISVASRYPVAPWGWGSAIPDYAIPLDVVRQEGIEWTERPGYNRVFVSGETHGLVAQVTRALTAGDIVAPMALHKAITHQYAAHERGLAILANTGRQALVSMETALIPSLGLDVILPGKLVQIGDAGEGNWRGLVRGVEITAARPKVTQKIELERHYL